MGVAEAVPELVRLAVDDEEVAVVVLAAVESVVVADDAIPVVAVPVPVDEAAVAVEDVLSVMPQTASTSKSPKGMFLASHSAVCRAMESGRTDASHFSAMQQK